MDTPTLIEIYGEQKAQGQKLDDLIATVNTLKKDIGYNGTVGRLGRAENRIEALEKLVSRITGIYLGIAAAVSVLISLGTFIVQKFWPTK